LTRINLAAAREPVDVPAEGWDRRVDDAAHRPAANIAMVNECRYRLNGQNAQKIYLDEIECADSFEDAAAP
jgi:hypothetical protein